jgi:hypothetical protein
MEVAERLQRTRDFVFPSHRHKGKKPLDLAAVLKRKIQPAFTRVGIAGVGGHTFRHTVGTMLAEMGEQQLTIRDYLRHSNLHVMNKYLQATPESKRLAQGKLVDAILPGGLLSAGKSILVLERAFLDSFERMRGGRSASKTYWTQTDPDFFLGLL